METRTPVLSYLFCESGPFLLCVRGSRVPEYVDHMREEGRVLLGSVYRLSTGKDCND